MIIKIQQQTPEWLMERNGRVTASRVADVMSRLKNDQPSAKYKKYLLEIVEERLTGRALDHYVSDAMAWGAEYEGDARAAYEVETGNDVDKCGIAIHPNLDFLAASPDGLVGSDGLWEGKCPTTAVHLKYVLANEVPEEYRDQCYTQMACWDRQWVDFTSFDPRLPAHCQLFVKRLERDDKRIAEIEFAVIEFDAAVREIMERLGGTDARAKLKADLAASVEAEQYITAEDVEWIKEKQGV